MYTSGHCCWPGPQTITCTYIYIHTHSYMILYIDPLYTLISVWYLYMIHIMQPWRYTYYVYIDIFIYIYIWGLNLCRSFPSTRSWQELYTQILHVYGLLIYTFSVMLTIKTTGNMPIHWVFGTGVTELQCCFIDSSKKTWTLKEPIRTNPPFVSCNTEVIRTQRWRWSTPGSTRFLDGFCSPEDVGICYS